MLRNGEYVGHIRRADHAFYLNQEVCYGYVSNKGQKVTPAWLREGEYQIESRGVLHPAQLHLKTPFDAQNNRIQGMYDETDTDSVDRFQQLKAAGNYR